MKKCYKPTARAIYDPSATYCKKCKFTAIDRNSILKNKCNYCGAPLDPKKPVFNEVPKITKTGQIQAL